MSGGSIRPPIRQPESIPPRIVLVAGRVKEHGVVMHHWRGIPEPRGPAPALRQTGRACACEQNVRERSKTPTKRQQTARPPPRQKADICCKERPDVNKKASIGGDFCFHAAFPRSVLSQKKFHPAESGFPMSAELAGNLYRKTKKRLPSVGKTRRKPRFPAWMKAGRPQKGEDKKTAETPEEDTRGKDTREDMAHPAPKRKPAGQKGGILPDSRRARTAYSRPLPHPPANTPFSSARK